MTITTGYTNNPTDPESDVTAPIIMTGTARSPRELAVCQSLTDLLQLVKVQACVPSGHRLFSGS
mgnify:CR=1 FL=1